jgi:hypothetical protein
VWNLCAVLRIAPAGTFPGGVMIEIQHSPIQRTVNLDSLSERLFLAVA